MIGSLRKIWPWKVTTQVEVEPDGSVVPLVQSNVLPYTLSSEALMVIGLAVLGLALVVGLEALAERNQTRPSPQPVVAEAVES